MRLHFLTIRHIHNLALDVRRLPGVGIRQEKCTSVLRARPAPIPLLALPCRAMSHEIRALTVGTVEDLDHHDATLSRWGFSASTTFDKSSRSTPLEHLPMLLRMTFACFGYWLSICALSW